MCNICPHQCVLRPSQIGWCGVRVGSEHAVIPIANQSIAALGIQQVEDHPLFHFHPGLRTLCVGFAGCTAHCQYCQNWELALTPQLVRKWQAPRLMSTSQAVIARAKTMGCGALSFTYNEAVVWREMMLDLAIQAQQEGLLVIWITNGYVTEETLEMILPYINAVKLDLKGFSDVYYHQQFGMSIMPILQTLAILTQRNIWHEISTVMVTDELDNNEAVLQFSKIICEASRVCTPWHLLRFFPAHQMLNTLPTHLTSLRQLRQYAISLGLQHVYISNIPNIDERHSYCPTCGISIAQRFAHKLVSFQSVCSHCGQVIAGNFT